MLTNPGSSADLSSNSLATSEPRVGWRTGPEDAPELIGNTTWPAIVAHPSPQGPDLGEEGLI